MAPFRSPLRTRPPEVQRLVYDARKFLNWFRRVGLPQRADTLQELLAHVELSLLEDTRVDPTKYESLWTEVRDADTFFRSDEGVKLLTHAVPPIDQPRTL